MSNSVRHFYDFGEFRIDVANRLLLSDGQPLPLPPKVVETLLALIQRGGQVISKDELMKIVWPDSTVEEGNLTQNIYLLRKTLSEGANGQTYIETIPRRGYRFTGEVRKSQFEGDGEVGSGGVGEVGSRGVGAGGSGSVALQRPGDGTIIARPLDPLDFAPHHSPIPALPSTPPPPHLPSPPPTLSVVRRLGIAALLGALVIGVAGLVYVNFSGKSRPPEAIESIAVLPFKPLTAESEDNDLGIGMTDALITQLSNLKRIVVRPTSAVLKYRDSTEELLAVGRQLGVDAVLDGRFQRADGRLRVTVQLIRVGDGATLWADKFDEQFTNLFAVQDAITERLMRVMAVKLSSEEQLQMTKRFSKTPGAYQAYLQGCYYLDNQSTRILESSIAHFQQALSLDPVYAPAYAGLADCYVLLAFQYDAKEQDQSEAVPKAREAARQAMQLNDQLPEAHAAEGAVKQYLDADFQGAERAYCRAIELNPGYAHGHHALAILLFTIGRLDEAEGEILQALEFDPLSASIAKNAADGLYFLRQYDQAVEQYRRALKLDPTAFEVCRDLGWAYTLKGMHQEAAAEFIEAMRLQNAGPELLAEVRQAFDSAGLKGFWRKWLRFQQGRIRYGQLDPSYLALVYAFLGDQDQAFVWLQKAEHDRSLDPVVLRFDPVFDALRSDARYTALLNSVAKG